MEAEGRKPGVGCIESVVDNSVHNPPPSTARGKRRHAARSEDARKRAEKVWNTGKTNRAWFRHQGQSLHGHIKYGSKRAA